MKQFIAITAIMLVTALPLTAQDPPQAQDDVDVAEGFSLIEEGAKLLLRGFMAEMSPAIDELRGKGREMSDAMALFSAEMGPALAELMTRVDDIRHYDAPAVLPNGDILIRRKPGAPAYVADPSVGEIEL